MKSEIRRFNSFAEADMAETEYYISLKPEQRLEILLELIEMHRSTRSENSGRLERVYRVVELQHR